MIQEEDKSEKGMLQTALGKTTATTRQVLASTGATTRHVLASTGATTRHVLASTGATTKALLGTVSDAAFWKDSLKWVRPLAQSKQEEVVETKEERVDVHWCHPFYENIPGSSTKSSKVSFKSELSEMNCSQSKSPKKTEQTGLASLIAEIQFCFGNIK